MFHNVITVKDYLSIRFARVSALTGLMIFVSCGSIWGATPSKADSLDAGFRQMYNLEFEEAHEIFERWEQTYPDDPLGPASNAAAYLFSEFDRLQILEIELFTDNKDLKDRRKVADPQIKAAFERKLAKADRLATEKLDQSSSDADALFVFVGFVVEEFGIGAAGDGSVDFFLAGAAQVPIFL